jgi:PIN domain nuclease of toxin-antitoxin system
VQFLLDTHVFLWLLAEPERLSGHIGPLEDPANELFLSAASSWEIAIKSKLGTLDLPDDPRTYVPDSMRAIGVDPLSVEHSHALAVCDLPPHHRDPFDRLLVAQGRALRLRIITADIQIALYDVETLLVQ